MLLNWRMPSSFLMKDGTLLHSFLIFRITGSTTCSQWISYFLQLLGEPGTGGSSTPSMVGAVKKWQKSDPQKSQETWKKLSESNSALETQLNMLSKLAEEHWNAYKQVIESCSKLKSEKVLLNLFSYTSQEIHIYEYNCLVIFGQCALCLFYFLFCSIASFQHLIFPAS